MTSFFAYGPNFIRGYQSNLNGWVPWAPSDAVWGCVKNTAFSFLATLLFTEGNIFVAGKSATVASVASMVHTAVTSISRKAAKEFPKIKWVYTPHGTSLIVLFGAYLFGKKAGGVNLNKGWTAVLTGLPYLLVHSKTNLTPTTPLFIALGNLS